MNKELIDNGKALQEEIGTRLQVLFKHGHVKLSLVSEYIYDVRISVYACNNIEYNHQEQIHVLHLKEHKKVIIDRMILEIVRFILNNTY